MITEGQCFLISPLPHASSPLTIALCSSPPQPLSAATQAFHLLYKTHIMMYLLPCDERAMSPPFHFKYYFIYSFLPPRETRLHTHVSIATITTTMEHFLLQFLLHVYFSKPSMKMNAIISVLCSVSNYYKEYVWRKIYITKWERLTHP
jgi:hypothetical protein